MFISKKDLDTLEEKLTTHFNWTIQELKDEIERLKANQPRPKTKKSVE